jgi:predicted nucleic acid-binding protein
MGIFIDSSVILSFCRSKKGTSAYIIDACLRGRLKGFISEKVVFEVNNNNAKDNNEVGEKRFHTLLARNVLTITDDASGEENARADKAINNSKDAPIIDAAKQISHITHILTLDNGFFEEEVLEYIKPLEILKPGDFVNQYRSHLE